MFRQTRVGLNGSRFTILKFRTMQHGANLENEDTADCGSIFIKRPNHPSITRVGKYLRRYSLDELPQCINVLKGDMSLVGPRPVVIEEYDALMRRGLSRRFTVKPGMTGLWQINGRSNTSEEMRIRYDVQYANSWSLFFDLVILLKTIPAVVRGNGAV